MMARYARNPAVKAMIGISLTRHEQFAAYWSGIIFELDGAALNQRFKIVPWNFFQNDTDSSYQTIKKNKNEYEEFMILKRGLSTDELDKMTYIYGKFPNLNRYLKGIWVQDRYKTNTQIAIEPFKKHKLFKGYMRGYKEYYSSGAAW